MVLIIPDKEYLYVIYHTILCLDITQEDGMGETIFCGSI